jgi:hypothetical protein
MICSPTSISPHQVVYDPEELKTRIVSDPEVLTVGDPVVVPL